MKTESGFEILFEDKWLLAVFKPAGIAVHHTPKDPDNNVQSQLETDYKQKLTLFHRLDKDTCGVLLFGKKPGINKAMSEAFEKRKIKKTYWALVEGSWPLHKKNITS